MFGNYEVKIIHIPGHTLGHICFFFEKEKIAFEISQMMEKAKKEINSERDSAILELKNRFGELVVDAAGKVIEKEIDEKSHSELIAKALEEKAL